MRNWQPQNAPSLHTGVAQHHHRQPWHCVASHLGYHAANSPRDATAIVVRRQRVEVSSARVGAATTSVLASAKVRRRTRGVVDGFPVRTASLTANAPGVQLRPKRGRGWRCGRSATAWPRAVHTWPPRSRSPCLDRCERIEIRGVGIGAAKAREDATAIVACRVRLIVGRAPERAAEHNGRPLHRERLRNLGAKPARAASVLRCQRVVVEGGAYHAAREARHARVAARPCRALRERERVCAADPLLEAAQPRLDGGRRVE
eukprot:7359703-Prymnesium_polylepis.1